jgi:hypothetical protein
MLIEAQVHRDRIEKMQRKDARSKRGVMLNRRGGRGNFTEGGINRLFEMRDKFGQIKYHGREKAVHGVHDATLVGDVALLAKAQSCADGTSRLHDIQRLWCWRRRFENEVYPNPTVAISDEATKKTQSAVITNLKGTAADGSGAEECLGLKFLDSDVLHSDGGRGQGRQTGKVLANHFCRMLKDRGNTHTYIYCVDGTNSNVSKKVGQGYYWRQNVNSSLRSLSVCNSHSAMNGIKSGARAAKDFYDCEREEVSDLDESQMDGDASSAR